VPFLYEIEAIPPRHRNPEHRPVRDVLPLKLQEGLPEGMRPAFRVVLGEQTRPWREHGEARRLEEVEPTEFWWDGRQLYVRVKGFQAASFVDPAADQEALLRAAAYFRCTPFAKDAFSVERAWANRDAVEGRVQGDDRRDRVADIVTAARHMRLADGDLFCPTSLEPVWRFGSRWERDTYGQNKERKLIEAALVDPVEAIHAANRTIFRADRLDQAQAEFHGHVAPYSAREIEGRVEGSLEVLDKSALRLRSGDAALHSALRYYLSAAAEPLLQHGTVEQFLAFRAVADELRRCKGADGIEIDDDLVAALRGLAAVVPDSEKIRAVAQAYAWWADEKGEPLTVDFPDRAPEGEAPPRALPGRRP